MVQRTLSLMTICLVSALAKCQVYEIYPADFSVKLIYRREPLFHGLFVYIQRFNVSYTQENLL